MNKQSKSTGSTRTDAVLTYLSSKTELAEFGTAAKPAPAAMSASAERAGKSTAPRKAAHVSSRPDSGKQKRQKILAMSLRNISGAIGMLTSTKNAALNYLQHSLLSYNDRADAEIREVAATLDAAVRELQAMEAAIRANNTVVKLLNEQETDGKKAAAKAERELHRQKRKELAEQSKQLKAEYAAADRQAKTAQALSATRSPFPRASYGSDAPASVEAGLALDGAAKEADLPNLLPFSGERELQIPVDFPAQEFVNFVRTYIERYSTKSADKLAQAWSDAIAVHKQRKFSYATHKNWVFLLILFTHFQKTGEVLAELPPKLDRGLQFTVKSPLR